MDGLLSKSILSNVPTRERDSKGCLGEEAKNSTGLAHGSKLLSPLRYYFGVEQFKGKLGQLATVNHALIETYHE